MSREQALIWLVQNLKEWSLQYMFGLRSAPDGWEWNPVRFGEGFLKSRLDRKNRIFKNDWQTAKEAMPIQSYRHEQALIDGKLIRLEDFVPYQGNDKK